MELFDNKHNVQMVDVFRIPVFSVIFNQHDLYKDEWSKYITDYEYKGKRKKDHFSITNPNLHKMDLFNPLRVFFMECLYEGLSQIGLNYDVGITSMWGTNQTHGQYHHMHTHGNSFFAGVYYLNSDSDEASGTIFQNVFSDFMGIRMNSSMTESKRKVISSTYSYQHKEKFEEGKLIIFPAWLRHNTSLNKGEKRQVIAFNTMPIGMTCGDPFDRYIYQDFRNLPMYGDDGS